MSKIINQDTLMPVGLAVLVIGSSAMWVADVRSSMKANEAQIEALTASQGVNIKLIQEINSRLSRIEWKLEERGK